MRVSLLALAILVAVGCQPAADPAPEASGETAETTASTGEATPGNIQPGVMAPAFTLTSADGAEYALADLKGKTVVLEWLNYGCPYVQKYYGAGAMQELQKEYASGDDVVWLSIVSSAPGEQGYYEADEMLSETEARGGNQTAVLLDASGDVGRLYGAKTTPQMFVISPEGEVVYNGAIDDQPVTNPESLEGATNYLVSAMQALTEGRAADPDRTEPYGCSVKYADA